MRSSPTLERLLGEELVLARSRWKLPAGARAVAGWGNKRSGREAEALARASGLPLMLLEDGFLRSVSPGPGEPPLSVVVDDRGIYYDASRGSRLESLVLEADGVTGADGVARRGRAAALARAWCDARVSKYNHARECEPPVRGAFVLAVDQTFGDASIAGGLAEAASFGRMLEAALDEHPSATVLLKVHPEVVSGRKRGHFDALTRGAASRVVVLAADAHPPSLLERAEAVYTVTSQMGFEALLWGRPARAFGMPFYAGWGLTRDELPPPDRRQPVALESLVHAALVGYPRYLDPETREPCGPERLIEWMGLQRRMRERFPREVWAVGFSRWKKPIVRLFFQGSDVRFTRRTDRVPAGAHAVVWGRKPLRGALPADASVVHLEDGFLRSVGLGADLVRPLSWVIDRTGIYYDATAPSDLERLLLEAEFDDALCARARALRERICAQRLSKYNVGTERWRRPPGTRRVILVPGQVESDASIRYGTAGIATNLALLRAVRERNPEAWIVYKPHPDVVAGLRRRGEGEEGARAWCDEIVIDESMPALLDQVDEVHVLTSLAGFEALLRRRTVVCYGRPFYAGWGNTNDLLTIDRRTRRLDLDELVAGVLLLYPTYVSRVTNRFTTPERALDELLQWRSEGATRRSLWRRAVRFASFFRKTAP